MLISECETPLSSAKLAQSVGTNPSFVRKILGHLKQSGLISSQKGRTGFTLAVPPEKITLMQVYQAVYGCDSVRLFGIHKNPNDKCLVGKHIKPTLESVFGEISNKTSDKMNRTTLSDCIDDMRGRL